MRTYRTMSSVITDTTIRPTKAQVNRDVHSRGAARTNSEAREKNATRKEEIRAKRDSQCRTERTPKKMKSNPNF